MNFIYGVVIGAALMVGSAYLHDIGMLGKIDGQTPPPFVNWDAVTGMLGR